MKMHGQTALNRQNFKKGVQVEEAQYIPLYQKRLVSSPI